MVTGDCKTPIVMVCCTFLASDMEKGSTLLVELKYGRLCSVRKYVPCLDCHQIKTIPVFAIWMGSAGSSSLGEVFQPKETNMACPDAKNVHVETFGLGQANNWRAVDLVPNAEGGTDYIVVWLLVIPPQYRMSSFNVSCLYRRSKFTA